MYDKFCRDFIKYTVIYGTYIIYIYMVLIKPTFVILELSRYIIYLSCQGIYMVLFKPTFVMPELQRCHGVHLAKWDLCYDLCQPRALCVNCVSHVH